MRKFICFDCEGDDITVEETYDKETWEKGLLYTCEHGSQFMTRKQLQEELLMLMARMDPEHLKAEMENMSEQRKQEMTALLKENNNVN